MAALTALVTMRVLCATARQGKPDSFADKVHERGDRFGGVA